jgi:hypothetical protein
VAKCGDPACSPFNTLFAEVDPAGGAHVAIAIGADGLPVISHQKGGLSVVKCGDAGCVSGNTHTVVDSAATVGKNTSIAVGTDGLPVIAYYDDFPNRALKAAKCANPACTGASTLTVVDSSIGSRTAIVIAGGLPRIAYYVGIVLNDFYVGDELRVTTCGNAACSAGNSYAVVEGYSAAADYPSMVLGADGFPALSFYNAALRYAKCGNAACSAGNTIAIVDNDGISGGHQSLAIGAGGLAVIVYHEATKNNLKVARCGTVSCSPW